MSSGCPATVMERPSPGSGTGRSERIACMAPESRILVVDDEPSLRRLLRLYLENEGYTVLEADNGLARPLKKEHLTARASANVKQTFLDAKPIAEEKMIAA